MRSDHRARRRRVASLVAAVRELLDEWDFLGVVPHGILDEYDCLVGPIAGRLWHGAGSHELDAFLATELAQHFGAGGMAGGPEMDQLVTKVLHLREQWHAAHARARPSLLEGSTTATVGKPGRVAGLRAPPSPSTSGRIRGNVVVVLVIRPRHAGGTSIRSTMDAP